MSQSKNNQIAKNSLFLYFRMAILLVITLYTSRVVLKVLGVDDYGIYNVVGGVISIIASLQWALSSASKRYICYAVGIGDNVKTNKIFNTLLTVHLLVATVIALIAECIGFWFISEKMNIPVDRLDAAYWVLHCSVISVLVIFINYPYNGLIVANEKFNVYAVLSIIDASLRLGIALILPVIKVDSLVIYAILIVSVQVALQLLYYLYCKKKYPFIKYRFLYEKGLIKEILGFSFWMIIGCLALILVQQGCNIILNLIWGVALNAAFAVAVQIQNAVNQFSGNVVTAIQPQIIKLYAEKNYDRMCKVVCLGTKMNIFLLMIPVVPLLFLMPVVLSLWLGDVPCYSVEFASLILPIVMCKILCAPLMTALQASGNIRRMQTSEAIVLFLSLPFIYIATRYIYKSPVTPMCVWLLFEFINSMVKCFIACRTLKISVRAYVLQVVLPITKVVASVMAVGLIVKLAGIHNIWLHSTLTCFVSVASLIIIAYMWGFSRDEKKRIQDIVQVVYGKIFTSHK